MGVRYPLSLYHQNRVFWNTNTEKNYMLLAYNTKPDTAFHWFHVFKAFDNKRDHRTYAQVTRNTKNSNEIKGSRPLYSDACIVTVTNEKNKVKSKLVAPSKVSVNAQGCTSPKKTLPRPRVQTKRDRPASQQKGFLTNRFHILTDWGDNSQEIRYTDKGGSHAMHVLSPDKHEYVPSQHGNLKSDINKNRHVHMGQCNNTKVLSQDNIETNETLCGLTDVFKPPTQNMSSCKNDTKNMFPSLLCLIHRNMLLNKTPMMTYYITKKFLYMSGKIGIIAKSM